MNTEQFQRVRAAFEAARELDAAARKALLDERFSAEPELREECARMLDALGIGERFLDPLGEQTLAQATEGPPIEPLRAGQELGAFVLESLIGGGGMGEVWRARQERPRRQVAIKALKSGLSTQRARERFEEESELLARLSHPNIAQVLASGLLPAPEGGLPRPWFAMELVEDAQGLTEYARSLGLHARIELLRTACDAVHHGHLRGVVHRDLKPDNLLVGREGRLRVIDFGIARASAAEESRVEATQGGELLGTLAYMSPEQVLGERERVDVRSDVHALGVLLYELLTGGSPWRADRSSWTAIAREVVEVDPPPPSQARPELSPELDWIVARALAKDPEQRFASAQELSEELGRFSRHEPLRCGPPRRSYLLAKFVRRNRAAVGVGLVALVILIVGSVMSAWGWWRSYERGLELEFANAITGQALADAESERARAEERADRALAINHFLDSILRSATPLSDFSGVRSEATVSDMLDRAAVVVENAFLGRPSLEADIRMLLGLSYEGQGNYGRAHEQFVRASELAADFEGEERYLRHKAGRLLGISLAHLGRKQEALELLRTVHAEAHDELDGFQELAALDASLAWALQEVGSYEESLPYARRAIERFDRVGGPAAGHAASASSHLASALRQTGRPDEAFAAYLDTHARLIAYYGEDSAQVGVSAGNIGTYFYSENRIADAVEMFEQALDVQRAMLEPDHPFIANTLYNYGAALAAQAEYERAELVTMEMIGIYERSLGSAHPDTLDAKGALALLWYDWGRYEDAAPGLDFYLAVLRQRHDEDHAAVLRMRARVLLTARARSGRAAAEGAGPELDDLYWEIVDQRGEQDAVASWVAREVVELLEEAGAVEAAEWGSRLVKVD